MPSPVVYCMRQVLECATLLLWHVRLHARVLDPYHVSPEGFDGHYEHKEEHKRIEDSLETLWCFNTKSIHMAPRFHESHKVHSC